MATSKLGGKRSLFNKPAWAATSSNPAGEETSIFSQKHLYTDILESDRKRRERVAEKARQRAEKEKKQESGRQSKRRRVSEDLEDTGGEGESDAGRARSRGASSRSSGRSVTPTKGGDTDKSRPTPQKQKKPLVKRLDSPRTRSQKSQPLKKDATIILDDEDDEEEEEVNQPVEEDDDLYGPPTKRVQPKQKPKPPEPESESEEEDEYLRQLKAEARRKAQLKRLGTGARKESTPDPAVLETSLLSGSPTGATLASPQDPGSQHNARATSTPVDSDDAEVMILIKTIIPGAKDIIVNRRISQPLDKVKEFWIKRFGLDPHIAAKVFFTWNNTRLYNSTTMRGIIERLKKTHPLKDGSGGDPSNGQILIEAVTDEIFEYRQNQRARKLAEASETLDTATNGPVDHQSANDHDAATPDPQPPAKDGIVIKLTARDFEDMMLRVRPNTTVAKILSGFCRMRRVDLADGTDCWLSYDGERLDPTATVDDVGFEHEDSVDVHVSQSG